MGVLSFWDFMSRKRIRVFIHSLGKAWLTGAVEVTTPAPKNSPPVGGGAEPGAPLTGRIAVCQKDKRKPEQGGDTE